MSKSIVRQKAETTLFALQLHYNGDVRVNGIYKPTNITGAAPSIRNIRILELMCSTAREMEAATLTLKVQERTGNIQYGIQTPCTRPSKKDAVAVAAL